MLRQKSLYILCREINRISRALFTPALLRRGAPLLQSASSYRRTLLAHSLAPASDELSVRRFYYPFVERIWRRISQAYVAHARARSSKRHTIKRALKRMEIFAGRCCCIPLVFSRTASSYAFCRGGEINRFARARATSLFRACFDRIHTVYVSTYARARIPVSNVLSVMSTRKVYGSKRSRYTLREGDAP